MVVSLPALAVHALVRINNVIARPSDEYYCREVERVGQKSLSPYTCNNLSIHHDDGIISAHIMLERRGRYRIEIMIKAQL